MQFELGLHAYGRFDHRLPIGPIIFAHYDLLWLHEGQVDVTFPIQAQEVHLTAPAGVLILPQTNFYGRALGRYATASVCHFTISKGVRPAWQGPGFLRNDPDAGPDLQGQIRYALRLSHTDPHARGRRGRLLHSILDGFSPVTKQAVFAKPDPIATAWNMAARNLQNIRSLADVAALIDVRESTFRALHRTQHRISAGAYLREMRLRRCEDLLATTGFPIAEIAAQIGYGHAETLCTAFRRSRGVTPGMFRKQAHPFA